MKCPDCNGELRRHPEVFLSLPPIYTYGCLKCGKIYRQRGEDGELKFHCDDPIDWISLDEFLESRKKNINLDKQKQQMMIWLDSRLEPKDFLVITESMKNVLLEMWLRSGIDNET